MTVGDLIKNLQKMDANERIHYTLTTHSELHLLAIAEHIDADCDDINRALTLMTVVHRNRVRQDPLLPVRCLQGAVFSRRAPDEVEDEQIDEQIDETVFH